MLGDIYGLGGGYLFGEKAFLRVGCLFKEIWYRREEKAWYLGLFNPYLYPLAVRLDFVMVVSFKRAAASKLFEN